MVKVYLKCGLSGKVIEMLCRIELVVDVKLKDVVSKVLMEMYGEVGVK